MQLVRLLPDGHRMKREVDVALDCVSETMTPMHYHLREIIISTYRQVTLHLRYPLLPGKTAGNLVLTWKVGNSDVEAQKQTTVFKSKDSSHVLIIHRNSQVWPALCGGEGEISTGAVLRQTHRWRQEHVRMFSKDELWVTVECGGLCVGF